ncbi:hypothetical protein GOP47_0007397 [Adiantum capillus-veneris]|uniref:Cytochrome P450 n=1 Tax=Adiantum capillus-veneris TaxID=13818 RepID=A0A9D4ZJ65_ADICA|nr:hypothetical protein GOP47_0007397 [Adiantum capillus-veneris]
MEPLSVANDVQVRTLSLLHYSEWLLLIAISAISVVLLQNALSSCRAASVKWPPGPPAWPIIGHLHLLGHLPHQSLCKLAQTYGPLLGLRLGGVPVIVASSPQMAKEILQTHDAALAYRPRSAAAVHLCFESSDVAYAPLGPYWKFLRQVYATELFSPKKMDAFRYVREGEVRGLARAVLLRCGEHGAPVEVRGSLVMASNNIICRMAMGKKLEDVRAGAGEEVESLHNLIKDLLHLVGVFYLGDYVPWLAWLDPHGYLKRMRITAQRIHALLQGVIDERRQHNNKRVGAEVKGPDDLLDVLLAASCTNVNNKEVPMTEKHIMAAIQDVFIGGSHSSAVTVEWALAELINHPKVMKKLHEELDNVIGKGRLVEESDIPNLTYLEYVVKESMRLHPIAPFLVPREAKQECIIGGFKICRGTHIYVNTWAIGRDSSTWEEPLEFLPERFLKKNIDLRGQHFDFLPFGMGRRRCPGWALGISNVCLMLATLVQAFTWHCTISETSQGILDMSEKFGLTVDMEKRLEAIATPRLPLHLY